MRGVPTPFYHISLAQEILASPALPEKVQKLLNEHKCDFYLGKTAPDVQTISGQKRSDTHFFFIPLRGIKPPWEKMLSKNRSLGNSSALPPAQAAFIAGYVCHLQADISWLKQVFLPYFGLDVTWLDFHKRLFLHNVMRAYLDEQILKQMPEEISGCLQNAQPDHWLPFVEDQYLIEWRDGLAEQLHPNGSSRTNQVFAERMGVPVEEIAALLNSEEQLEEELFAHIPRQLLVEYRQTIIRENLELLETYFGN
jgi:hypothetical protein